MIRENEDIPVLTIVGMALDKMTQGQRCEFWARAASGSNQSPLELITEACAGGN